MIRGAVRHGAARPGYRRAASAAAPIRPVGDTLITQPDPVSGIRLTIVALGVAAIAVVGVAFVIADYRIAVAVCLVLLGACALLALRFAESWRETCRRSAGDVADLLDIVDEIGAVVCVRDAGGRYLLVNRQFEQLNGVRREDVLGHRHQDLFPAADTVGVNDRKALFHGAPVQTQDTVDQIDGPHTYYTVRHPVTDTDGRVYAVCGISTDITDVMRAEEEVRRLVTDLEQRVRDRTADLEASIRDIDAFTYSASHDLRAPLRVIAGFSEILLEDHAGQLDQTGRDYLDRVHAATGRMTRTIDALLDLCHAGRGELRRSRFDLGDLARDIVADLRAAEPDRRVETVIGPMPVAGDPVLLSLVMQNLLSNAWKFTSERGEAHIGVGTREYDGVPAFYVEDDGAGFDMQHADQLFAPFQRLHSTARFPGTGIGLAVVERVVGRHGGRVWAESTAGGGATFYFTVGDDVE
ncbi:sensor histidine kinase [Catenulispora rubra]|uniref:sensor histidine kinase n=1 Tax=Catenulispora rubra TaxID=280293 RepID=UPI001891F600|nr:ATP-binding protein [Catenulispora rubra]